MPDSVSVIIPCFNESATIAEVVKRVRAVDLGLPLAEIIVVDDGSTDGSWGAINAIPGIKSLQHERNQGKGAAVMSGVRAATGRFVVIQDADLEYSPSDLRPVLAPLACGEADVVLGSRFAYERPTFFFGTKRSPFFSHYAGNLLIIAMTNLLYGARITDYEGAYKAFARDEVDKLDVRARGFEFDNELVCRFLRRGRRVVEVPIKYAPRSYEQGKKITWQDGAVMLWTIIKWRVLTA